MSYWIIYILECRDGTFYTGITNNLAERIARHEEGTGAKYTRGRGPFHVRYIETCAGRGAALQRENAIKAMRRPQKLRLMQDSAHDTTANLMLRSVQI